MKILSLAFPLLAGAIFLLAGCATKPEKPPAARPENLNEKQLAAVQQCAAEYVGSLIEAIKLNDYRKLHTTLLVPELQKRFPEKAFRKFSAGLSKKHGQLKESNFVCTVKNPLFWTFVWKFGFVKSGEKTVSSEFLYHIQVGRMDGKYKIFGFWLTR